MATRTVARLYDSYDTAAQVVNDLEAAGIAHGDVSIVSNDARHRGTGESNAASGAGTGASIGTVLGGGAGLLAGIGALAIPGVGPVVAAGWLVATLAGAGVGAAVGGAAGGLVGSLTNAGVPEEEAHVYGEGVRRGGTLVTARVDEADEARVRAIMDQRTPVDWRQRQTEYRQAGWTGFDPNAGPYETTAPAPGAGAVTEAEAARLRAGGRV